MNTTSIGEILFDIYPSNKKLGGAPLNFIYHIRKITGSGNIISRVGNDALGSKALTEIRKHGFSVQFIQQDDLHPTGIAAVSVNENAEPSFKLEIEQAFDYIETNDSAEELINYETDVLYFGTLAQRGEKSRETIHSYFGRGIKYFCDLNFRQNFYNEDVVRKSLETADILKVSYAEMKMLNDMLFQTEYNTEKIAFDLMEQFQISLLAVTRGKDGATLFENGKRNDFSPTDTDVLDTTGAGDAFSAVICIGFMQGWDLMQINKYANDFASEICKVDGALPKSDRIYEELISLANGY